VLNHCLTEPIAAPSTRCTYPKNFGGIYGLANIGAIGRHNFPYYKVAFAGNLRFGCRQDTKVLENASKSPI
jgi:hypothetical protein